MPARFECITAILEGPSVEPCRAYAALAPWQPFALLESAMPNGVTGRRSFLGLSPQVLFQCADVHGGESLVLMQSALDAWQAGWDKAQNGIGCLFPVFAYEWKNALEDLPQRALDDLGFPAATLMACRDLLVWDHVHPSLTIHCSFDAARPGAQREAEVRCRMLREALQGEGEKQPFAHVGLGQGSAKEPAHFPSGWTSNMTHAEFLDRVRRIKEFIAAGDIYQANLSQRFVCAYEGSGFDLYQTLRRINPSPFGGYLRMGEWELISCSPERLVCREGDCLHTRPIAGTRPRGNDAPADRQLQSDLLLSPKERAEHVMLVDLERNDLGRVCRKGSVSVNEMMSVEKYSHVQHIVSNVEGTLREGMRLADILQAVFPGGTITGVPKIRCMEILDALEPSVRGPYTGTFGYYDSRGKFDLNIAIRTLVKKQDRVYLQAGAGIVADSDPEAEYRETLEKAKAMALAVETSFDRIPAFQTIKNKGISLASCHSEAKPKNLKSKILRPLGSG